MLEIHLINLDRNQDRLATFAQANRQLNHVVRFPAVNGAAVARARLVADGVFADEMPGYSNGAVGCALSHLSLWQKAAAQTEPLTVAEDDAIFNVHFETAAAELLPTLPPDWDIILWGWNFDSMLFFDFLPGVSPCMVTFDQNKLRQEAATFHEMKTKPQAYPLRNAFGSLAYTVSPGGARKLLRHCLPIREMNVYCPGLDRLLMNEGIDLMMNALYGEIGAFVCFPPLAVSKNEKAISTVNPPNHLQQANILLTHGKHEAAIEHYKAALQEDAKQPAAWNNLGGAILGAGGSLEDAAACFEEAVTQKPDYADAYTNLAHTLRALGQTDQAAAAYYLLGNLQGDGGKLDEAVAGYRNVLELKPDHVDAHTNLVITLRDQGALDEARACCRKALELLPDSEALNFCDAYFRLLTGDFAAGWRQYEWRWFIKEAKPHGLTAPLWHGRDLAGGTILLHCEQGLGDSIHFIRYAPLVKARNGRVVVACPASLAKLFAGVAGVDGVFVDGAGVPEYSVQAPLMSLPGIFHTTLETVPADVPYLHAETERVDFWKEQLANSGGLRVGIAWRGSVMHDAQRAMAAQFATFLDVAGVCLVGLQKDATAEELAALNGMQAAAFFNAGPMLEDFSETAAVIGNLDLVISVDTSVCHLAGALAAPVWTLIPSAPDWRWLLERADSPWYPTMRLFRQSVRDDWSGVMARLREELAARQGASSQKAAPGGQ